MRAKLCEIAVSQQENVFTVVLNIDGKMHTFSLMYVDQGGVSGFEAGEKLGKLLLSLGLASRKLIESVSAYRRGEEVKLPAILAD